MVPRLIFSPKLSALKASVIPRMASGGPWGTLAHVDACLAATMDLTATVPPTRRDAILTEGSIVILW